MRWASHKRDFHRNNWEDGLYTAAFSTEMAVKNAGATGYCSAMKDILNFKSEEGYDELYGAEE